MIIDTIADNIINVVKYDDVKMKDTKTGWVNLLFCWRQLGNYVDNAIVALCKDDWKTFKKSLIEYMEDNGYKGCYYYNQFKRLSIKTIADCILQDDLDTKELWYVLEETEEPGYPADKRYSFWNSKQEVLNSIKFNYNFVIRAYTEGRGLKIEDSYLADEYAWLKTDNGIHVKFNVRKFEIN
jgi:hypothetical protein